MGLSDELTRSFRWIDGHADVWRWFSDHELFRRIVVALADPFRRAAITSVAAVEARGFLLAGAVASELDAGVIGIRKRNGALPGPKDAVQTAFDYRSRRLTLTMRADLLSDGDRVLLVDDWIETGSQALAARMLIEGTGATFAGFGAIVRDRTPMDVLVRLQPVHALVDAEALGSSDALPSEP